MVRHHAWAGSVLLGILGAVRWFVADTDYPQKDLIFMTIGILLVIYIFSSHSFSPIGSDPVLLKNKTKFNNKSLPLINQ